jgi:hypothetical protein
VGTAFRLLQHDEKNSFPIKETCMRRRRAHRSTDRRGAATAAPRPCARRLPDRTTRSRRIVETPANWAFHLCRKIRAQPAMHGLTAFSTLRQRRGEASPSALFTAKKKFCVHLRGGLVGGALGARGGARLARIGSSDSQTRVLGSILQALDEARRRSSQRRFPPAQGAPKRRDGHRRAP